MLFYFPSFHNSQGTFLSLHTFSVHSLSTIMFYWQLFVFILHLLNCEPLAECVDSMTLFTQFLSFCLSHITKWRLTLSYWFRNVFLIEGESTEKLLLPYITDHTVNWPHTFRKQFGKLLIKKKRIFHLLGLIISLLGIWSKKIIQTMHRDACHTLLIIAEQLETLNAQH